MTLLGKFLKEFMKKFLKYFWCNSRRNFLSQNPLVLLLECLSDPTRSGVSSNEFARIFSGDSSGISSQFFWIRCHSYWKDFRGPSWIFQNFPFSGLPIKFLLELENCQRFVMDFAEFYRSSFRNGYLPDFFHFPTKFPRFLREFSRIFTISNTLP